MFFAWYEMDEYRRAVPPGFCRTAEEEELAQTFGLDDEQLAWRRWCIDNNCGGDLNRFHQEYPATPEEAFIATGQCVFDKAQIILRLEQVRKDPWERGMFRIEYAKAEYDDGYEVYQGRHIAGFSWEPDPKGPVRIRKHPEKGVPYVVGADTAGIGTDFFAAHVLDNRTGEQVAVLHHRSGERMFAEQLYCLGMYYNEALVGIETNYSTYPQLCMEEMGYTRFYVRQVPDTYTGRLVEAFGFQTTVKTRPLIIDGLKDVARYAMDGIWDFDTLTEMLTFVYDENWKPQAEEGEHDDLVMSLAIAHHIRCQQGTAVTTKEKKKNPWTQDMWDDFERGSPEDREIMIRMWGDPMR